MASFTRFSLTSSSALCRLLINRNAGLVQQHLPSMIIPSAATQQQRSIATSLIRRDIDSAAKYIGAGAATVGVAGAGAGQLILIIMRK
jgi:hypothetical protein